MENKTTELDWLNKLDAEEFKEFVDELKEIINLEDFKQIYWEWKHSFTQDLPIPTECKEEDQVELTKPIEHIDFSSFYGPGYACCMKIESDTNITLIDFKSVNLNKIVEFKNKIIKLQDGKFYLKDL